MNLFNVRIGHEGRHGFVEDSSFVVQTENTEAELLSHYAKLGIVARLATIRTISIAVPDIPNEIVAKFSLRKPLDTYPEFWEAYKFAKDAEYKLSRCVERIEQEFNEKLLGRKVKITKMDVSQGMINIVGTVRVPFAKASDVEGL